MSVVKDSVTTPPPQKKKKKRRKRGRKAFHTFNCRYLECMAPADAHGCVVRILPWKELLSNFWENRLKIGALGWASNLCVDVLKVISKLPFLLLML